LLKWGSWGMLVFIVTSIVIDD